MDRLHNRPNQHIQLISLFLELRKLLFQGLYNVKILFIEDFLNLLQFQPPFPVKENLPEQLRLPLPIEAVPGGLRIQRLQKADLIIIPQSARAHACQLRQLPDSVYILLHLHATSFGRFQHIPFPGVKVKGFCKLFLKFLKKVLFPLDLYVGDTSIL